MKNGIKIVVVEDDPSIRFGLQEVFEREGFEAATCERGDEAEELIGKELPDLIILDVMLPGKNGYEICKNLRERKCRIPILMLTAKGQEIDKVVGLDSGADDYVTKPFGVQELVARVKALLRRCERLEGGANGGDSVSNDQDMTFLVGLAEIDERKYEITRDGESERLTPKEMELLKFFHRHRGEVMSRDIFRMHWSEPEPHSLLPAVGHTRSRRLHRHLLQ